MARRQAKTYEGLVRVASYVTEEVKEALEEVARRNKRSVSAELAVILERWLIEKGYIEEQ